MTTTLTQAIADLPVAAEDRTGYERDKFRHWVDADRDGCNTRAEVLIAEAVVPPMVGPRCSISGGLWHSYYDDVDQTAARSLDIDHMVPLAESWDSGASAWTAAERQTYANDLDDPRALVAVTARENRSKADQDPAEWLPSDGEAVCRYVTECTAVKTRWDWRQTRRRSMRSSSWPKTARTRRSQSRWPADDRQPSPSLAFGLSEGGLSSCPDARRPPPRWGPISRTHGADRGYRSECLGQNGVQHATEH